MTTRILFATRSAGKQRELRQLAAGLPFEVVFPDDAGLFERSDEELLENADTFEGNARRKAEHFARLSGLPTLADDSGLEVFSLGGAPGVRSKRFAPPSADQDAANNAELLRRLHGAPLARRAARYRCVFVWIEKIGALPQVFEGSCNGSILEEPRGSGGFGYDPLFLSVELGQTFGEASAEKKHAVSHRGRAFQGFAAWLAANPISGVGR